MRKSVSAKMFLAGEQVGKIKDLENKIRLIIQWVPNPEREMIKMQLDGLSEVNIQLCETVHELYKGVAYDD